MYVWSILMYGCETWALIERDKKKKLEAMKIWIWIWLLHNSWTEKKSNAEILQIEGEKKISIFIIFSRSGKLVETLNWQPT